jgi:hypothetical protein
MDKLRIEADRQRKNGYTCKAIRTCIDQIFEEALLKLRGLRIWITNFLVKANTEIRYIIHASPLQDLDLTSLPGQLLLCLVARSSLRKILQPGVHRRLHQPSRLHTTPAKPQD